MVDALVLRCSQQAQDILGNKESLSAIDSENICKQIFMAPFTTESCTCAIKLVVCISGDTWQRLLKLNLSYLAKDGAWEEQR